MKYIVIATSIRNEALNLKEWIDYHLKIGVEHFYLYDNQSKDNTEEVLKPYINKKQVTYVKWDFVKDGNCFNIQDVIDKYKDDIFWLASINVDEFIVPMEKSLTETLKEFEDFGGLGINWLFYGSSGHIKRPEGGILKNYLNRSEFDFEANKHIKTIANAKRVKQAIHSHFFSYIEPYYCVDEKKNKIKQAWSEQYSGNKIRLHHYYCKSKEDYHKIKAPRFKNDKEGLNLEIESYYTDKQFNYHDRNEVYDDIILRSIKC